MTDREAILGLMMGERIKAALIMGNSLAQGVEGLAERDRKGAESLFVMYLRMLLNEVTIASRVSPQEEWDGMLKSMEKALVMAESGVAFEAPHHLTDALTKATTVAGRTMKYLQDRELL